MIGTAGMSVDFSEGACDEIPMCVCVRGGGRGECGLRVCSCVCVWGGGGGPTDDGVPLASILLCHAICVVCLGGGGVVTCAATTAETQWALCVRVQLVIFSGYTLTPGAHCICAVMARCISTSTSTSTPPPPNTHPPPHTLHKCKDTGGWRWGWLNRVQPPQHNYSGHHQSGCIRFGGHISHRPGMTTYRIQPDSWCPLFWCCGGCT